MPMKLHPRQQHKFDMSAMYRNSDIGTTIKRLMQIHLLKFQFRMWCYIEQVHIC